MPTSINIWPGSGSAVSGSTPFGLYDTDPDFQRDAPNIAKWIAMKLGYPLVQIELSDTQIYAVLEEAVSEYSTQINNNNVRNWLYTLMGSPTSSDLNNKFPIDTFSMVKQFGNSIATEVGAGGLVDWKTGSIELKAGVQTYDLQELWGNVSESNARLEIKEVWHYAPAAMSRIYSPYLSVTQEFATADFENFGALSYESPVYFMMPIYYDVLRAQAIELNQSIRKSNYTWEIINNKLKIAPIPRSDFKLFFRYTTKIDPVLSGSANSSLTSGITDISNVPYHFLEYKNINSMGRQWIKRYTLALSMEILGNIRKKYNTIPIPTGEVTLDGDTLIQNGKEMRDSLINELKELLRDMSSDTMAERASNAQDKLQSQLNKIPLLPYMG